jgi:hypothetical protein
MSEMVFAQDHHVVQALPTDRANQSLRMAILLGWVSTTQSGDLPDAIAKRRRFDGTTVASVAVADQASPFML